MGITAQEKEVSVKDPRTGKTQVIIVKVWNETVANLTLMALGSSAPEIMLSVIEIWAKGFKAGDLGPGTIVGSAAFNLFMIIGLCMYVIPPTGIYDGYPTFVISILFIGACTAVIGDIAGHLGCFINLKDCVNAIAFVALGTSVPDTFASKTAAIEDETADNSVGNVTGSNAVNVFLGIGIAWTMAAVYWEAQGQVFKVPVGSLGFSVTIFCIEALLAIGILLARRHPAVGGELGGPKFFKTCSSSLFVFFWVFYVAISAMEAYDVIEPGF